MNNGQNSSVDYENVNAAQELIIPVLQYHHNPGTIFSNFSFCRTFFSRSISF